MKWLRLALVVFLTACAQAKGPPKIACSVPCSYTEIVRVDPAFSETERVEIWKGLQTWPQATGALCFRPQVGDEAYGLTIVRGENQLALRPYSNKYDKLAAIQKDRTIVIAMDKAENHLANITAHEIGHVLGLDHKKDSSSVMHLQAGDHLVGGKDLPLKDYRTFHETVCR